jgi:glycerophosphoryl diester phosphodiesterase
VIILAHRGHWIEPSEKNSLAAFERAFSAGHGVELDVRDRAGDLVISHDPPDESAPLFAAVLALYRDAGLPGRLAVNVKADGLAERVADELDRFGAAQRAFAFDMSVPDMLAYVRSATPVFTRFSEYEPDPALYGQCEGVWIDSFLGPHAPAERAIEDLKRGKAVALVSPELHKMPYQSAWAAWAHAFRGAGIDKRYSGQLMVCTDFPAEANDAFAGVAA